MNFNELLELISDIEDDPSRGEIRFGCDCGCGGDYYTEEEWDVQVAAAEVAVQKLVDFGVDMEGF